MVAFSDRYNRVWVGRIREEHSGLTQKNSQKGDRMHQTGIGEIIGASYSLDTNNKW